MRVRKYQIKYDPFYLPKTFQVADILAKDNVLHVKDQHSDVYVKRHPKDLKRVNKDITCNEEKNQKEEYDNELWKTAFDHISQNVKYNDAILNPQPKLWRSQRIRKPNPKYFNSDYVQ